MGLKDQNFAMRWVQRNIKNFGGDPGQVTIAGQSAGGASTHYHMLSKLSKGLFHKAISASGVAVSPWAFNKYPREQAVRFARRFCPTENTTEMVACLKLLPATTIQDAHVEVVDLLRDPLSVFVPTVEAVKDENAFITEDPLEIAKNESVNKVPWLAGVTADEGLMFTAMTLTNQTLLNAAINDWMYLVPRTMYLREDMDMKTIVAIKEQYFGNATTISADSIEQYQNFTNVFSDRHFFSGLQAAAPLHAKHSPVYLYYFSHLPKYSIATLLLSKGEVLHPIVDFGIHIVKRWIKEIVFGIKTSSNGTSHIDDLGYIFNLGIPGHIQDEIENEMSRRIVKLYTSFASSNGESDVINFGDATWPPLNSLHSLSPNDTRPLKYMDIGLNPKIIDEPFTVRVNFWNSLDLS
jgi:carboxylesterase type B